MEEDGAGKVDPIQPKTGHGKRSRRAICDRVVMTRNLLEAAGQLDSTTALIDSDTDVEELNGKLNERCYLESSMRTNSSIW